jgi:hypothetical protein
LVQFLFENLEKNITEADLRAFWKDIQIEEIAFNQYEDQKK